MATIYIGSARKDENGAYAGGNAGDQLQTSNTNDTAGEVSMQTMYTHSKGWYVFRPIDSSLAEKLADRMKTACNNKHIGYDQGNRLGIISYGIDTTTNTECDCSSLVRQCLKEASGVDVGNFTTATEASMLENSGLFDEKISYVSQSSTPVYNGDILVTKSKGHTAIVVDGNPRVVKTLLDVDGVMGTKTTKRAQEFFGTTVDGYISGQLSSNKDILKGITSCKYVTAKGSGSSLVKAMQKWLGVTANGIFDTATIRAWQKKMGTTVDGKISKPSNCIKAFQEYLNKN